MLVVFDKRIVLFFQSFGQHGRELITSEVALRLLRILSEEYTIPNLDLVSLNNILEKLVIKVSGYKRIDAPGK